MLTSQNVFDVCLDWPLLPALSEYSSLFGLRSNDFHENHDTNLTYSFNTQQIDSIKGRFS